MNRLLLPLLAVLPVAPCPGWTPGTYPTPMHSRGFTVDSADRNDVVAFWNAVYLPSEAYVSFGNFASQWGGNYNDNSPPFTGSEGVNPPTLVAHTERRINFFRALAGLPADVQVNTDATVLIDNSDTYRTNTNPPLAAGTTKKAAVQRAAYMIVRTYGTFEVPRPNPTAAISHDPQPGACIAWTTAAWNANKRGNLSFGFYGPGAIDAYMVEDEPGVSNWNVAVGHRRWVLFPRATNFATGDTPGSFVPGGLETRPPTNVLYVEQKPAELGPAITPFVAYPSRGFFPAPLNSRYWSLSRSGANFQSATVSMTTAGGVPVPITIVSRASGYGDNSIVWEVPESVRAKSVAQDTTYHVTVASIGGAGVPTSHAYSVTLIDPRVVTADQSLVGTASPPTSGLAKYRFTPPTSADALRVDAFQPVTTAWTEGGEDATASRVIDKTTASYDLRSTVPFGGIVPGFGPIEGAKSLRLTIPVLYDPRINGLPSQSFELERDILPGAAAKLNFRYRRGYMTQTTTLAVESSQDGGLTWSAIPSGAIVGKVDGSPDMSITNVSLNLAQNSVPVRLRFRLAASASAYTHDVFPTQPTGIFIDAITTTNCQWLDLKKSNDLAPSATEIPFNSTTAGVALANNQAWRLRLRAKLGNHWMPHGPMKALTVTSTAKTGFDAWLDYENPDLLGGFTGDTDGDGVVHGIEYAFDLDPRTPAPLIEAPQVIGNFLTLQRPLAAMRPGVTYAVEWSETLTSWNSNGAQVSHNGGILTGRIPLGVGPRYMRWKITKN